MLSQSKKHTHHKSKSLAKDIAGDDAAAIDNRLLRVLAELKTVILLVFVFAFFMSYLLVFSKANPASNPPLSAPTGSSSKQPPQTAESEKDIVWAEPIPYEPVESVPANNLSSGGHSVFIVVSDKSGSPVADATVALNGRTANTNFSGIATFNKIPPGNHEVKVISKKGTATSTIDVDSSFPSYDAQEFNLVTKKNFINPSTIVSAIIILVVATVIYGFRTGRLNIVAEEKRAHNYPTTSSLSSPSKVHATQAIATVSPVAVHASSRSQVIEERLKLIKTDIPKPSEVIKPTQPPT